MWVEKWESNEQSAIETEKCSHSQYQVATSYFLEGILYYYALVGSLILLFILKKQITKYIGNGPSVIHPDFDKEYEFVDDKPLAGGANGEVWRVKKKDDKD